MFALHNKYKDRKVFLLVYFPLFSRQASVSIIGKEKKQRVGKLGWDGSFEEDISTFQFSSLVYGLCANLCFSSTRVAW